MADVTERGDEERWERSTRRALPTFNGKQGSFPVWKARVRAWLQAESPSLLYVLDGVATTVTAQLAAATASASATTTASSSVSPNGSAKATAASKRREERTQERQEMDRQRVYNALISSLDDTHVGIIVTEVAEGDAQGAWRILLRKYERNTVASRNQLRRELHTLRLKEAEGVDEYKARALHIASRLRATKEVVSDGEVLYCLLEGLPPAYDMVRQALEVQDIVDLEAASNHLREMEERMRRRLGGTSIAQGAALNRMIAADGSPRRSPTRRLCLVCLKKDDHVTWQCPKRQTSGCYRCAGTDHQVSRCPEPVAGIGESEGGPGPGGGKSLRDDHEAWRPKDRPATPMR
jgi:hypothetical protein